MRCLAFVIILQSATCYVGSFDLPKPLDNFYEEVVRFYKRLRSEGGKQLIKHLLFARQHVKELLRQCWEDIAIYFLSMSSRYTVLDIDVSSECQTYYFLGSYLIIKDSGIHEIM